MGYLEAKSVPACLRNHYEKLLFPYDVFQSGLMTDTPTEVTMIILETQMNAQTHTEFDLV